MMNQPEAGAHGTPSPHQPAADDHAKFAALQSVPEELRSLDPKTFGAISGMMNQSEAGAHGTPFRQHPAGDDDAKLAALQPVLGKAQEPRP